MELPKHAELWLPAYLRDRTRGRPAAKRLWVALTDHYEPMGGATPEQASDRVGAWETMWPVIAEAAPGDSAGRKPCFTFFYPQEEYRSELVERLAQLSRTGTCDVEVHLHHAHETAAGFRAKITDFCARLHEDHGLLRKQEGKLTFGFIHGNWALDNSLPGEEWCGLTGELALLRELGCYADFTMPSIPSASQSRIVNRIYWATGDPQKVRGFDQGIEAKEGGGLHGTMLMVTGPTGLRFDRKPLTRRWWPRIETGELAAYDPPTPYRVRRWLDFAPRIGSDIFLKLFGHSAREANAAALLGSRAQGGALLPMFHWLHEIAQEQKLELHWVSAYEMYRSIRNLVQPAAPPSLEG